ncbi:MAG: hypothetical protein HOE90_06270 [Bacteriovoracaceae bacterium]|jgi:hypothetical protein|nr:hypothetical protein [Bacteriovoracaceae bacterium]
MNFFVKIFLTTFILSQSSAGEVNALGIVRSIDQTTYRAQDHGLTDLAVDIYAPQIRKKLNDALIFGDINNLVFKVYWVSSGKRHIEIKGIPSTGFPKLKEDLRKIIEEKLEYLFPRKLEDELSGFDLFYRSDKGKKRVVCVPKDELNFISEIVLSLDKKSDLKKITKMTSNGATEYYISLSRNKKSKKMSYVKEARKVISRRGQEEETKIYIRHMQKDGFWIPDEINIYSSQKLKQPMKRNKLYKRNNLFTLDFRNYQINKGKAQQKLARIGQSK